MRKLLVLATLAACSTSGSGSLDPADVETYVVDEFCAHLTRCGLFTDRDACLNARANDLNFTGDSPYAAALAAAVDAGTVKWDGHAASTCYAALLDPKSCDSDAMFRPIAACADVAVGTLDAGATCTLDEECGSARCDRTCTDGSTCCAGTCRAGDRPTYPTVGEQCVFTSGNSSSQRTCLDSICEGGTGKCEPYAKLGESCATAPCAPGQDLVCDGSSQMCVAAGTTCRDDGDCVLIADACDQSTQTCITLQLPGGPCSDDHGCAPSYRCDAASSKCVDRAHVGEACASSSDCQQRGFCDQTSHTCAAPLPVGAACTASEQCEVDCDTTTMTCRDSSACEL